MVGRVRPRVRWWSQDQRSGIRAGATAAIRCGRHWQSVQPEAQSRSSAACGGARDRHAAGSAPIGHWRSLRIPAALCGWWASVRRPACRRRRRSMAGRRSRCWDLWPHRLPNLPALCDANRPATTPDPLSFRRRQAFAEPCRSISAAAGRLDGGFRGTPVEKASAPRCAARSRR